MYKSPASDNYHQTFNARPAVRAEPPYLTCICAKTSVSPPIRSAAGHVVFVCTSWWRYISSIQNAKMNRQPHQARRFLRHVGAVIVLLALTSGGVVGDGGSCAFGTCSPAASNHACLHDAHVHKNYECMTAGECTTCVMKREDVGFHPGGEELKGYADLNDIQH